MCQLSSSNRLAVGVFARGAEYRKYCLGPDNAMDFIIFYNDKKKQKVKSLWNFACVRKRRENWGKQWTTCHKSNHFSWNPDISVPSVASSTSLPFAMSEQLPVLFRLQGCPRTALMSLLPQGHILGPLCLLVYTVQRPGSTCLHYSVLMVLWNCVSVPLGKSMLNAHCSIFWIILLSQDTPKLSWAGSQSRTFFIWKVKLHQITGMG